MILAVAGVALSPMMLIGLVAVACAVQVILDLLGSRQSQLEPNSENQ